MLGLWGKGGFIQYWKETLLLYDDLYFSRLVKGNSIYSRKFQSLVEKLGIDSLGAYKGDNVTFFYYIDSLPRELPLEFKDILRRECRPDVKINFLNHMRGHRIDWNSTAMRNRLRVLAQVGKENNSADVNSYNIHENLGSMDKQNWIEGSLHYLAVADIRRNRSLIKSSMLMTITGARGDDFDDSVKAIEQKAKDIGVSLGRVLYDVPDTLRYFSPFSKQFVKDLQGSVPTQVLSDELVARYNTYSQGTLGVSGIYFGTDVISGYPVLKVVKPKDDTAENWLFTAKTGGGKSYTVKDILLQLLALEYNGTIMDIEGFEYIPIANFISHEAKVLVINMAEGSGSYFDPVEIAEPTGIEEIDKDAKNMSMNFTLAIYKTLLGKAYDEDIWLDTVVNDAVAEMYSKAQVRDEPETWSNSKGLTLFDVHETIKELKTREFRKNEGYLTALDKALAITSRYFEPDGTRSSIFKHRVKVSDIIDAKLVVCSFGMAGRSPQSVDAIQLALMQISAAQISHQRSIFSKSQGLFNFKLWEEFQRWGNFPDADKTIGVAITGGRKLGDVNMIVTNDVGQILKDDRFGILANITSFMIGAISDDDVREKLTRRLSIPHMKPELDAIADANNFEDMDLATQDVKVNDSPLAFAFLAGLDRSKFTVVKIDNPEDLKNSKLYKTGVDLKG